MTEGRTKDSQLRAHLIAIFTIVVWSVTFVCTKVLLQDFSPVQILFTRFAIGFLGLCLLRPHILHLIERRHEWLFIFAALTGLFGYYLLENVALTFSSASNIGVAVSTVPIFSAILNTVLGREKSLTPRFILGFVVAMTGIVLISLEDLSTDVSFVGDLLAIGASCCWAVYSTIVAKIAELGYETIATTKRIFLWGVLFVAVALVAVGDAGWLFSADGLHALLTPKYLFNLLFLGFGASAMCFVTWNYAVKKLGATTTSVYIYSQPVLTVLAGVLILSDPFTWVVALGVVLTLAGTVLSCWSRQ